MDVKPYIDYFDEIAHLDREQQFTLLEKAFEQVNGSATLPVLPLLKYSARISFVLIFMAASYLVFGSSTWALVLSALFGLLGARLVITEISDKLIRKALKSLLSE
ncbi:hypothetical protein SNR37_003815 [Agarivorans aestuarii]|uniref:Uncharacterized protein n=1 Tax=Agarivorans aestuarii TaxID=1563703 RepID=A0ABU7G4Q6_9ALTE|nr:hypothetical protein [Agarivorans aestuarii]MEE1674376.1 hypothetical protein [Agarivorans aestuarii]